MENINDLLINPQLLLKNNYKNHHSSLNDKGNYIGSFQKKFDDETGNMFFLNFDFHDMQEFMKKFPEVNHVSQYSWTAHLQLHTLENLTVDINIGFSKEKSLEDIEKWATLLFKKMNFQYEDYLYKSSLEEHKIQYQAEQLEENIPSNTSSKNVKIKL